MKKAIFYEKIDNGSVQCLLCPHGCKLAPDSTGRCRARKNLAGDLYSLNYERLASVALDPIEKKPLRHFHPGKRILSVGTFGCNFKCSYCQNWSISQGNIPTQVVKSSELADLAMKYVERGSIGVAYTYNEPSIWYEYVLESAELVRERGLVNVLVTNGFINPEPLTRLLPYVDAMNIDVKAFNEKFYSKYCKGSLDIVKKTVEQAVDNCHVEITTLIIPGLNDSTSEIGELAKWLSSLNPDIALHLTRFYPSYLMTDIPPTPDARIAAVKECAESYLRHVY